MKKCKRKYLKDQPKWKYKAIDMNGEIYYFTHKPSICIECYPVWEVMKTFESRPTGYYTPPLGVSSKVLLGKKDWRKSLRKIVD
jgi:hypothetical protein